MPDKINWLSFKTHSPEPDTLVLMWDQRNLNRGIGFGYKVIDFDHDSDAEYWLRNGMTHWAYLNRPDEQ